MPLLAALVAMPVLAYGVTTLVLVPHFQKSLRGAGAAAAEAGKSGHAETEASTRNGPAHAGQRQSVSLNRLLVNVAGTMGSRYLLASVVVMGDGPDFQGRIAQKEPQLRDLASGLLSAKTIADLEKPGARNLIRGELLAGFNTIVDQPGVSEIYFTEFAIQ
jgi:flagellar FliL protein